jgi:hypothetical protein
MDAALGARLQQLIRSESRSLLQYVSESFPWTTAHDQAVREALQRFACEETEAIARLTRQLTKHHVTQPFQGSYPMSFTTVNFCSLSYLLPRLIDDQKARIADVERVFHMLEGGEIKDLLAQLLVLKKQHLSQLGGFAATMQSPPLAS